MAGQVQELQNQQGGLGTVLGLVGGYLAANPARKQAKADRDAAQQQRDIENKRNATNDAATQARDRDYHDEITARIAQGNATAKRTEATDANTALQNGAITKARAQLAAIPAGVDPVAWANQVWQKAVTADATTGGLGLTDPKLQGELRADIQAVIDKAAADQAKQFVGHEMTLSGDPKTRLSQLMNRLQRERNVPGLDLKPTQTFIDKTQKQIIDMENRAHQAVLEQQGERRLGQGDQRLQISIDRGGRSGGAGISPRADLVFDQAIAAPDVKAALKIVDKANLPDREYRRVRQQVEDQYKEGKPVIQKTDPVVQSVLSFLAAKPQPQRLKLLTDSDTFKKATPDQQNAMLTGLSKLP